MAGQATGTTLFLTAAAVIGIETHHFLEAQEAALREGLAMSGADTLELATDDDLLEALLRFADLRRHRARLRTSNRFPAHLRRASVQAEVAA